MQIHNLYKEVEPYFSVIKPIYDTLNIFSFAIGLCCGLIISVIITKIKKYFFIKKGNKIKSLPQSKEPNKTNKYDIYKYIFDISHIITKQFIYIDNNLDEKMIFKLIEPKRITHKDIDLRKRDYYELSLLRHSIYKDNNIKKIFEISFLLKWDLTYESYPLVKKEIDNKNYIIYLKKDNETEETILNTKDHTIRISNENIYFRFEFKNPEVLQMLDKHQTYRGGEMLIMLKSIEIILKNNYQ